MNIYISRCTRRNYQNLKNKDLRNGKVIAKLTNQYQDRVDVAKSLFGVLSSDITIEEAREERLGNI